MAPIFEPGESEKSGTWFVKSTPRLHIHVLVSPEGDDKGVVDLALAEIDRTRRIGISVAGYGHPYGLATLREHIAGSLRKYSLSVGSDDVLLTQGVTQALDLIVRTLLKPGDTVLVEDPCYCNLLEILKVAFVNVVSVSRKPEGIDSAQLEDAVKTHRPKAMFINTVLQNPSGTSLSASSAFRLLQIADREGIWIIEDDISRELAPPGAPCLAAMEGLQRVIYVSGFSKSITPAMRVGYIAASRDLVSRFAMTKMAVGLTSSEVTERAVASVLIERHYDWHIAHIRERLFNAHASVTKSMADACTWVVLSPRGACVRVVPVQCCDFRRSRVMEVLEEPEEQHAASMKTASQREAVSMEN